MADKKPNAATIFAEAMGLYESAVKRIFDNDGYEAYPAFAEADGAAAALFEAFHSDPKAPPMSEEERHMAVTADKELALLAAKNAVINARVGNDPQLGAAMKTSLETKMAPLMARLEGDSRVAAQHTDRLLSELVKKPRKNDPTPGR